MKKIILPFAFALFCFAGCNNDDDKNATGLLDTWTLVEAGGGFAGVTYEYDKSVITAKFKANGDVVIVNNNTDETKPGFFETGTYDYAVAGKENGFETCEESMTIDNAIFYCYQINEQDELILDDSPVDGLKYTFVRN